MASAKMSLLHIGFIVSALLISCTLCQQQQQPQPPASLHYTVREQLAPGTFVGDVSSDAGLGVKFSPSDWKNGAVSFTLGAEQSVTKSFFRLTAFGVLLTATTIDRETFCARKATCDVALTVQAQSPQIFLQVSVVVSVVDAGDSTPFFSPSSVLLSISEAAATGTSFPLPLADDLDSPTHSASVYSITSATPPGIFSLRHTNSSDGTVDNLYLVLMGQVDRERTATCYVTITASDVTSPSLQAKLAVNVTVIDVNDNAPMFTQTTYVADVAENAEPGAILVTVTARDADGAQHGDVTYSLSEKSQRDFGSVFGINPFTGALTLVSQLDYETTPVYHITVMAKDSSLYSSATVIINVIDVNDHEPVITVMSLAGGCGDCGDNVSIPPTTPLGTTVAALRVADADSGESGTFDCSVTSQYDAFDLVQGDGGSLTVKTALHFDKIDVTTTFFDLVCRDRGSPSLSTDRRITVNVVTNHPPVFSRDFFDVAVRGDAPLGESIVKVQASDSDQGYGGRFFYELDAADSNVTSTLFAINVTSGDVSAKVPLNRQRELSYVFHVVATDQGIPPMASRVRVRINVTRVAMERPVFQPTAYVFNVMENLKPPISVGQVFAFDSDWPPFNTFSFEVVDTDVFEVDADLGLIQTRIELDREMTSSVQFKVKATDAYNSKLFSLADVTVHVLDSNDNAPIILFPTPGNDTINVFGALREDQLVGRIVARDFDTPSNAVLSYAFVSPAASAEQMYFRVDNESGLVFATKDLNVNDFNGQTFVMQVRVADLGNGELQTLAKLFVVVRPGSALGLVRSASVVSNTGVLIIIVSVMGVVAVALVIAIVVVIRTGKDLRRVHRRYSVQAAAERDYLRRQQSKEHVTTQIPNNVAFLGRGPDDDDDDVDNGGNSHEDDGASCGDHSFDILGHGGNYVWLPSPPMSAQRDCDLYRDVYNSRLNATSPLSNHSKQSNSKVNTFLSNDRIDDDADDTWQSRDQSTVRADSSLLGKRPYGNVSSPTGKPGRPWSPRDQLSMNGHHVTTFTQPERDSVDSGCSSGAEAVNDVRPKSGQRDVIVPHSRSAFHPPSRSNSNVHLRQSNGSIAMTSQQPAEPQMTSSSPPPPLPGHVASPYTLPSPSISSQASWPPSWMLDPSQQKQSAV